MSEPRNSNSTPDSVARLPVDFSPTDRARADRLLDYAFEISSHGNALEQALQNADPAAALAGLREMMEREGRERRPGYVPPYPMVRACVMQHLQCVVDLDAEVDREIGQCLLRQAGYATDAFASDPGAWLSGATRTSVRLLRARGVGLVKYRGDILPWRACVPGSVRQTFDLVAAVAAENAFPGGILIGPPNACAELALPDSWTFVTMQVTRRGGVPDGSERGPNGGGNGGGGRVA